MKVIIKIIKFVRFVFLFNLFHINRFVFPFHFQLFQFMCPYSKAPLLLLIKQIQFATIFILLIFNYSMLASIILNSLIYFCCISIYNLCSCGSQHFFNVFNRKGRQIISIKKSMHLCLYHQLSLYYYFYIIFAIFMFHAQFEQLISIFYLREP